ncbi:structural maintenance of chromosomes protein 6 isoform X2 [Bradysia coprophila]|uniref:structural maintenance of chromosomes protein 6 isoform X2 n=1 Tax=Bradysia coprophila TaxID=38358 RepID=UPI00187D947A|nr:structural maintenance of chromosomes protein 6 isoform X2 [Bradysia coprophila]
MSRKRPNNEKLSTSSKRRHVSSDDEESDDAEMQMVDTSVQLKMNPIANRSGKINKIILKNFMCHSNLVIEFNKNVNLLIGNNGSGKSAILTALIVGLGSKSSATSRCTNIAQLIKRGETSGSVVIHIANNCEQGYDRETYGPEIIVQRTFSSSGSSSYRIKKSSGQLVTSSRKDLMKILLFMNIQVDNPVCVLNQDASRAFLKESDPKKRFKFFLKATQIDTVIEKLNDCSSHYVSAKKQLEFQKNVVVSLKAELEKIQTKFDSLQSIGYLKKTLAGYKAELVWLKVENEEKLQAEITETLNKYQKVYDNLMEAINNRQTGDSNRAARCELLGQQINELKREMGIDTAQKDQMRRAIAREEESRNEVARNLQKIQKKLETILKNIKQLENDMSESSESQRGRIAMEKEANGKKLEILKQKKDECSSIKQNVARDIEMMRNTKTKLEETISNLQDKRFPMSREADKIKAEIRQCESSKNSLSLFGAFMPELINAIEQMHRKGEFRQMPRGPLGNYIEVVDHKFKGPVEAIIGKKLFSFVVDSAKDREVLNRIMAKIAVRHPDVKHCSIISMRFKDDVYDISDGKVESVPNGHCVLDVIRCSDPVVTNVLIDHCKLEQILLADDQHTAFNFTSSVENVPQNLFKVIVLDPPTEMYPAPNLRTYALKKMQPRYLQVNMEQRKRDLTNDLRDLDERLVKLNDEIRRENQKKTEFAKTLAEKTAAEDKFDDKLRALTQQINQLERIEYPGENERGMLESELRELTRTRDEHEKEREIVKKRVDEMQAAIDEKRKELTLIEQNIQNKSDKIGEKQMEINNENDLDAEEAANANAEQRKVSKIKGDLEKLQAQERECDKKLKSLIATANNQSARVPITNTPEFLTAKIKETEKIIKTVTESSDSLEAVEQALELKSTEYTDKKELIDHLEKTLAKLKSSRQNRYMWLLKFKSHVSLRVQHEFNKVMKLRNYEGTISIDHQKELLELSVIPRDKNIANSVSSANCLSGGERSFSTVAFLLALWSVVDSPFYFLDEYDVYTDAINRYYMTTLLLGEAKKKQHRQYTFLTPQDMSEIVATNELSIQRLADPIRK